MQILTINIFQINLENMKDSGRSENHFQKKLFLREYFIFIKHFLTKINCYNGRTKQHIL